VSLPADERPHGALSIEEHHERVGDRTIFWRSAGDARIVYVHGVPTHSADWLPFLERTGGFALDLPGFGRSGKARDGDYTMRGLARAVGQFVDHLGLETVRLAVHDWGGLALVWAMEHPDRIERLLVVDAVALVPGYRWHWIARLWRRRGVGELFMATSTRAGYTLLSRQSNATKGPLPEDFIDAFWSQFDSGTRHAILQLYRSAPESELEAAAQQMGRLTCPSLVIWGAEDPYTGLEVGRAYARQLPASELLVVPNAGHWPWLDDRSVIATATGFLGAAA
jgi:pimeloyl-ACP methyl ester carboxylesterase